MAAVNNLKVVKFPYLQSFMYVVLQFCRLSWKTVSCVLFVVFCACIHLFGKLNVSIASTLLR